MCIRSFTRIGVFYGHGLKFHLKLLSQPNLYPTVGLQTPGEVVDANFGQAPFVFDIGDMINELRVRTRLQIINYPTPDHGQGQWQEVLHKYVSTRMKIVCEW